MSRKKNAALNVATGLFTKIFEMVLHFGARIVFVNTLGAEYLGLSGLFTSVLTLLNISELGIETAIIYSMYKPLADGDEDKLKVLVRIYKKACMIIGCVVLVLGLCLIPFLPNIIGETDLVNVNLIYILYLMQTVISYWFFAYRTIIINADQKSYVLTKIKSAIVLSIAVLQIVALILFKNYVIYLLVAIVLGVVNNLLSAIKAYKLYPFLKEKTSSKLSEEEVTKIKKDVFGLFCYKISSAVLNSTDSIIISFGVSIAAVGMFDNYNVITKYITTFMYIIFGSYESSVGNLYVTETKEKTNKVFYNMNFVNFWIYGFCTICFFVLINPFIELVFGKDYLLSEWFVLIMFLLTASSGLQQTVYTFSDGCGLFWEGKWRAIIYAVINIVLSFALVKPLKIEGVMLATLITHVVFSGWYDPYLLFKYKLESSLKKFFLKYGCYLGITVITAFFIKILCNSLFTTVTVGNFVLRAFICFSIPNILFFVLFRKCKEFNYFYELIGGFIKKITNKQCD